MGKHGKGPKDTTVSKFVEGAWQARRLGGFGGFGRTALRLERSGWASSLGDAPPTTCMSGPGHVRALNYGTQL